MNLDKLAPKIARRDGKAFEELYEETRRLVYSVCLGIVKNGGVAEELTQDTFVAVWTKSSEFRGKGYKTWILTVAKNKSINALKKLRREFPADFEENENLGGSYAFDTSSENGIALSAALRTLEERDRQIVLMKNSGAKTKEIAAFLGLPRGTVSWRYAEALKILKKRLEESE